MKKTICLILSVVLALTLLCGCGGSATKSDEAYPGAAYADSGAVYSSAKNSGSGWAAEAAADAPAMKTELSDGTQDGEPRTGLPANVKLIYRANIDMESTEFDEVVQGLNELVSRLGGYFENSELDNYSNYRHGIYTVRLPAENFDTFCGAVGDICQVNNLSRSAEDISELYYDTESRLVTQQTKLARLQELMKQAEDMEDIITLESAISETELAIEQLTGTLRKYDSLVSYATVTLYLTEVYKLSTIEQPAIGFGAKLAAAFRSGCSRFVDNLQDFLLEFARAWVGWLIFIVIVVIAILLIVRGARRRRERAGERRRSRKERRAARKAPAEPAAPAQISEENQEN
jgi:hypothetical protein